MTCEIVSELILYLILIHNSAKHHSNVNLINVLFIFVSEFNFRNRNKRRKDFI